MSKKIIITEGQLKMITERKHTYVDNSPEGEMEEEETIGAESAIISLGDEDEEIEESEDMDVEDEMMNESLKAIKANFKRFL